jgi:myo-inositol 2-dehydrogenase / D-chiro-inositol 1-dehydrogenase
MTRLALCGVGNIGKVHLGNLRSLRGCEVSGIFSLQMAELTQLAAANRVRAYPSAEALFSDSAVDAVVIASPSDTHRALVQQALAAGKHVFVEKPLADTLEDAEAIVAAAKRHPDRVVQVGFCERFNPQYIEAKNSLQAGSLGRVRCIHSSRVAPYGLGNPAWQLGALDTAVHNLDLILWLLEEMPVRVYARGVQIYPESRMQHSVTSLLEFASGALVTDTVTWLADAAHPLSKCARSRMHLMGERGSFEIDLSARPSALLTSTEYREVDTVLLGGEAYYSCLKLQFEAFLRSVEEGAPVLAPVNDAYQVEQVVLHIQTSLQLGAPVVIA